MTGLCGFAGHLLVQSCVLLLCGCNCDNNVAIRVEELWKLDHFDGETTEACAFYY